MKDVTIIIPDHYYLVTYTWDDMPGKLRRFPRVVQCIDALPKWVGSKNNHGEYLLDSKNIYCECFLVSDKKTTGLRVEWYNWEEMTHEEVVAYQLEN